MGPMRLGSTAQSTFSSVNPCLRRNLMLRSWTKAPGTNPWSRSTSFPAWRCMAWAWASSARRARFATGPVPMSPSMPHGKRSPKRWLTTRSYLTDSMKMFLADSTQTGCIQPFRSGSRGQTSKLAKTGGGTAHMIPVALLLARLSAS